jgi:hypothetical protein
VAEIKPTPQQPGRLIYDAKRMGQLQGAILKEIERDGSLSASAKKDLKHQVLQAITQLDRENQPYYRDWANR